MSAFKIWNYFKGYVMILIEGVSPERLINLLIVRGIALWKVERIDYTSITARMRAKDFKKIRPMVRRSKTRVRIKGKVGFPFFLSKLRSRKTMIIGPILAIVFLFFLSSHIWVIEIKDSTSLSKEDIVANLKEIGVSYGTSISKIDPDRLQSQLLISMPQLAWVGVEIRGVKLVIDARDRTPQFTGPNYNQPSDIVADKNGIIDRVVVKRGKALVEPGDVIGPGSVLVTGNTINNEGQMTYGPAVADIYARVQYQRDCTIPYHFEEYKATSTSLRVKKVKILGFDLGGKTDIPFEYYDKAEPIKKSIGWRNFILPVEVITEQYRKLEKITYDLSPQQAENMAFNLAFEEIKAGLPENIEIVNIIKQIKEGQGEVTVSVVIETIEEIGYQKILSKED